MANATWLEAALNGGWGRRYQLGIPMSVADIVAAGVACARDAILAAGPCLAAPAEARVASNDR